MPLMTWNDKMSVGIKQLDDDHKRLIGMLNELHDAFSSGKAKEILGGVLDRLAAYTVQHFKHEEDLFAKTNYPASLAHKKEHENLTKQVLEVQKNFKSGATLSLSLEVMNFLKDWLNNHIQGSDKKYGPHLNASGIH